MAFLEIMGVHKRFGMMRPWKYWVDDRAAFARSIDHLQSWDFDRIAMAHVEIVSEHGKTMLIDALRERDLLP